MLNKESIIASGNAYVFNQIKHTDIDHSSKLKFNCLTDVLRFYELTVDDDSDIAKPLMYRRPSRALRKALVCHIGIHINEHELALFKTKWVRLCYFLKIRRSEMSTDKAWTLIQRLHGPNSTKLRTNEQMVRYVVRTKGIEEVASFARRHPNLKEAVVCSLRKLGVTECLIKNNIR